MTQDEEWIKRKNKTIFIVGHSCLIWRRLVCCVDNGLAIIIIWSYGTIPYSLHSLVYIAFFFLFFTCIHVNCPIRLHVSSIPCHIHWPMWLYIFEQWPCPMFMAASHLILTDLIDAIKWLRQHDRRSVSLSMVHDRACMLYICRLQVLFTIVRQINYDNINL